MEERVNPFMSKLCDKIVCSKLEAINEGKDRYTRLNTVLNNPSFKPFLKRQILHFSKLKEFADDNFKFDENGRKFSKRVENTV